MSGLCALRDRWERLELQVRCALSPGDRGCIQVYLHLGRTLARAEHARTLAMHLRMLRTLLLAGEDDALPGSWRAACLEQAALPLAQVTSSCRLQDKAAVDALERHLAEAWHRLQAQTPRLVR